MVLCLSVFSCKTAPGIQAEGGSWVSGKRAREPAGGPGWCVSTAVFHLSIGEIKPRAQLPGYTPSPLTQTVLDLDGCSQMVADLGSETQVSLHKWPMF